MKHLICLLIVFCLMLSGCNAFGERLSDPVTFYYVRSEYEYENTDQGVIAGEQREASGHQGSLPYLMAMYFLGPVDEELRSPVPRGTTLLSARHSDGQVFLELSDTTLTMTDVNFTLAGACLTMTCLEITNAESVTITSGSRSITMTRDTLTLYDSHTGSAMEETK